MVKNESKENKIERPPVVVVMGHIDHGKSTLLDYIRKSNIVDKEAGGITQHLSAYEVIHKDEEGTNRKITFLDTPGHEAFSKMRERGATIADIAILVVSAEDSVKAQTLEAWNTIVENKVPFIVAINKIDKPGANVEKTKMDLAEKGIYLEGFGGDVPYAEISAKEGTNISHLLDLILLVAQLNEFTTEPSLPATGITIESSLDPKRGMSGTIIIKDGTLKKGMFVVIEDSFVTTRIMENFLGKSIDEASACSPVRLLGFDREPRIGAFFSCVSSKKEALSLIENFNETKKKETSAGDAPTDSVETRVIPIIIRTDVAGTGEAVVKEIKKLELDNVKFKILSAGVGSISEGDIRTASADKNTIIIGFNSEMDPRARDLNEKEGLLVMTFSIIYKISDFLKEEIEKRKPRIEVAETTGKAKIIKIFSATKDKQVIGGKVIEGILLADTTVKILRRDFEIGQGKIVELQQNKLKSKSVNEGDEFGMQIESKTEIAAGDVIEAYKMVVK